MSTALTRSASSVVISARSVGGKRGTDHVTDVEVGRKAGMVILYPGALQLVRGNLEERMLQQLCLTGTRPLYSTNISLPGVLLFFQLWSL